jgi:hypothetical protein
MKVFKDKEGNKLTASEFFSRWGEGIKQITPYQKLKFQLRGTFLILIGLICGLIISIKNYKTLWWVAIILLGALIVNGIQYFALRQQKSLLKRLGGA